MKRKKRDHLEVAVSLVIFFLMLGMLILLKPSLTGMAIFEQSSDQKVWDFVNHGDYSFNPEEIEIVLGTVQLAPNVVYNYWNTTEETDYPIIKALNNPKDKTSKVNALDGDNFEKDNNKIFDLFFPEELDNGNTISLYIKSGNQGNLILCDKGDSCESGYGIIEYNGEEGWYNFTLSNLPKAKHIFNLQGPKVKIDYITSTTGNIILALFNPNDKIDKVNSVDDKNFEVNKADIFDIIFAEQLNNGDLISLYLKSGSASELYLCAYGQSCASPGYGKIDYDGGEGWYNITINGLSSSTDAFNLDPEKVKINFIKGVHLEYEEHSASNVTYAFESAIETSDLYPDNLFKWGIFNILDNVGSYNINYSYSLDSGISWIKIPADRNLSAVNIESGKIRINALLSSNQKGTPSLSSIGLSYLTQTCIEEWNCSEWTPLECPETETQTRTCLDLHECETTENKPVETKSCEYISPCQEEWSTIYGDCAISNLQLKTYLDLSECGTVEELPEDDLSYLECDYCELNDCSSSFTETISSDENNYIEVENENTNLRLEINTTSGIENALISIVEYNWTDVNTSTLNPADKYFQIESDLDYLNTIENVKIIIYYTDEELAAKNFDESKLSIYYHNQTSNEWEKLDTFVNTEENYAYAFVTHFSLYGLFGEEIGIESFSESTSISSSPGGHSGGSSKGAGYTEEQESVTNNIVYTEPITTIPLNKENGHPCDYVLEVSLPEQISMIEEESYEVEISNNGNCNIEEFNLQLSAEFENLFSFSPQTIKELNPGQKQKVIIIRKTEEQTKWYSFLNGAAVSGNNIINGYVTTEIQGKVILEGKKDKETVFNEELKLSISILDQNKVDNMLVYSSSSSIFLGLLLTGGILIYKRRDKKQLKRSKK